MKTKHTQGEWYIGVRKTTVYSLNEYSLKISVECDDEAEQKASIKLIAAAPDLLEALIKLNDYFFCEKPLEEGEYEDLINITQNAIKKATT